MATRIVPLLVILATASACTSAADEKSAESLCVFGGRPRPSIMQFYDKTSRIYLGEIDPKVFGDDMSSVPSAMAKPRIATYRHEVRADCRDPKSGAWYPCTKMVEVDLSKVEVIVRGYDMKLVAQHALAVCNKRTLDLIPLEGDVRRLSSDYRCRLVAQKYCPLK